MFVIIIFYDDCSDDHAIVVFLACSQSVVYLTNCKAVTQNLIYKFITRLNESTSDVILATLSSDIGWNSHIMRSWVNTLYVHHDLVLLHV